MGALCLSGLVLLSGGCYDWEVVARPDNLGNPTTWKESRVTYPSGVVVELEKGRMEYPMLHGEIRELKDPAIPNPLERVDVGIPTKIDLRLVKTVETVQIQPGATSLLVTGVVLGGGLLIGSLVYLGIQIGNSGGFIRAGF